MDNHEINLIKNSFAKVVPISDTAAELFYGKLFELDPQVKPLFKGDMTEQGRKLMQTLGIVVNSLDRFDKILPAVRELAQRHVSYGVKPDDYATVGAALLWTLGQGLGADFTPEVEAAWAKAYTVLTQVMHEAAAEVSA